MEQSIKNVEDLIRDLEVCGYTVRSMPGNRHLVQHEDGRQTSIPGRLTDHTLKEQLRDLKTALGFDRRQADRLRKADQKQRQAETERQAMLEAERANNLRKATQAAEQAIRDSAPLVIKHDDDEDDTRTAAIEAMAEGSLLLKDAGVRFDVMEIDYDLASSILATHNNPFIPSKTPGRPTNTNRPFHNHYTLEKWAKDMVNGGWSLLPQGIAFALGGALLDGQNRLLALVWANERWQEFLDPNLPNVEQRRAEIEAHGVTIPMVVSYDWDPAVFDRLDQGRPRTLTDLLAVGGQTDRTHLAAMARLVWMFDVNKEATRIPIANHVINDWIKAHQPYASQAVTEARNVAGLERSRLLATGAAAGVYLIRRAWPQSPAEREAGIDRVSEFLYGLAHGAIRDEENRLIMLESNDPRAALRSYLTTPAARLRNRDRRHHMGLLIKTWNLWAAGRGARVMRLGKDESFPVPVVVDGAEWDEKLERFVFPPGV